MVLYCIGLMMLFVKYCGFVVVLMLKKVCCVDDDDVCKYSIVLYCIGLMMLFVYIVFLLWC